MRRARRIFWLGLKEVMSLRRDWVMLALLAYAFTLAPVMEATGVATSVNNGSIAFSDEDNSPLSRSLAAAFLPPEFQPVVQIEPGTGAEQMDAGRFLFVVSVPWYRPTGSEVTLIWGLPDWVAVALACYVGVAILNSIAWLLRDIEDPPVSGPGSAP